jgi:hypothetical protein
MVAVRCAPAAQSTGPLLVGTLRVVRKVIVMFDIVLLFVYYVALLIVHHDAVAIEMLNLLAIIAARKKIVML